MEKTDSTGFTAFLTMPARKIFVQQAAFAFGSWFFRLNAQQAGAAHKGSLMRLLVLHSTVFSIQHCGYFWRKEKDVVNIPDPKKQL